MKYSKTSNKKPFSKNVKGGDIVSSNNSKFDYIEPVQAQPLEVKVYNNFDKALKAFRALVQKERILSEYKERQAYEKPSDKSRRKRNEMQRKLLELEMKEERESNEHYKKKDREESYSE